MRDSPSAIEREHGVRKDEAESLVVADGREEAGAGGEESSERRQQWRVAVRLLLRAGERKSERASGGVRLAAGAKADGAGHTSWPTRARPSRRMCATLRPSSAGSPRRHGAVVRARAHVAGVSAGKGVSAGGLGRLRPVG